MGLHSNGRGGHCSGSGLRQIQDSAGGHPSAKGARPYRGFDFHARLDLENGNAELDRYRLFGSGAV
jgi:hypothetical protein